MNTFLLSLITLCLETSCDVQAEVGCAYRDSCRAGLMSPFLINHDDPELESYQATGGCDEDFEGRGYMDSQAAGADIIYTLYQDESPCGPPEE